MKPSRQFPEKSKIGDVRNIDSLRKTITGNIVINLAAVHRDDVQNKDDYKQTNVNGAKNVISVCNENKIDKIIFTSTVAVYGLVGFSASEEDKVNPFNEYGRTKFEAEEQLRSWQSREDNSLIIIRPTVIFGEGNRGNVYNLLNQIALGKFLMVGAGENKKSMAYIGNIVAFLEACILSEQKYALYNYVDTPDLTMNHLVHLVRKRLKAKDGVGLRVPFWLGLLLGYLADGASKLTSKNLPVSSLRVKKFAASSQFQSAKASLEGFVPPFRLEEGLDRTLRSEFLSPDPDREIFLTE